MEGSDRTKEEDIYLGRKMTNFIFLLGIVVIPLLSVAPLYTMALPQGWVSGFVKNAPMPIDVELQNANTIFRSATWYLNATDHNYHVKGFVENTVSRAGLVLVVLNFYDNATGTRLATGGSFSYGPPSGVAANVTIPFDIDTGYNATDSHEFKTIDGDMV
jgi:hypothetical protein